MSERAEIRRERFEPIKLDVGKLAKPPWGALAERFLFGAGVALLAGLVGMRFGPRVGGLFLAFPAILPAALSMIEKKEGKDKADIDALGAVLGSAGMVAFAATAALLLTHGPLPALGAAWLAWLAVAGLLFLLARGVLRRLR